MSLARNVEVQLFEITIRVLGGVLSIYHLTEDKGFLGVAVSRFDLIVQHIILLIVDDVGETLHLKFGHLLFL